MYLQIKFYQTWHVLLIISSRKHVLYFKFTEVFADKNEVNLQNLQFLLCCISVRLSQSNFSPKMHLISSFIVDLRSNSSEIKTSLIRG